MNKLLDVIDLSVGYKNSISNFIIENFNFYIDYSEIFGLIGPSGCGKTTIAWTVIGMINEMNGFAKGKIFYKGQQIFNDKYLDIEKLWWKEIAIVPQVSMSSFNPSLTIKETLIETMDACNYENDKNERCFEIMDMVQLDKKVLNYYPHEMSGGMKQRATIATEYQDSNILQDTFIKRIRRDDNVFMVGDVKQSIYKFRLAEPEIFQTH